MKKIYILFLIKCFFIILILFSHKSFAQCLTGYVPTGKAFDTTVTTGSGNYETFFKFPKFHPDSGMVTCVKLTMSITGNNSMFLENHVSSPTGYNVSYNRKDTISGQGLSSPLTQQITKGYGPYNLAATDGVAFSGPDFVNTGTDVVLNNYSVSRTITDVNEIQNFYGLDSITYRYVIKAAATVAGSGDYLFSVSTTGFVNYKLEYCYCPPYVLPLGLKDFEVLKTGSNTAKLNWQSETDTTNFYYEVQMSRDGKNFTASGIVQKTTGIINPSYHFQYTIQNQEYGRYYFRIKQRYPNGYVRFSAIKSVDYENSFLSKVSLYPNPSAGIVGIKFVNISAGKLSVRISNIQGQVIVSKEFDVSGTDYKQIATLQRGMYWLKIMDVTSKESFVNQLLIK